MATRSTKHGRLYLHFPCFDGAVSAALAAQFLETERGWSIERFVPVNYEMQGNWSRQELVPYSAVVDFLYHPSADFWADHHITGIDEETLAEASADPARTILFDPKAPSCARVIWSALHSRTRSLDALEDTVKWADKIDSASYDSPEEAILGESPALDINLSLIERLDDEEYCNHLVGLLRREPLDQVAHTKEIARIAASMRKRLRKGLREAARNVQLRHENIVTMRVAERGDAIVSRYAPFYFEPSARYSVSLVTGKRTAKITAMRNPWANFESIQLGRLFSEYGGGGHQRVASVLVTNLSTGDRERLADLIAEQIYKMDSEQHLSVMTA
jgi:hypothetical protein